MRPRTGQSTSDEARQRFGLIVSVSKYEGDKSGFRNSADPVTAPWITVFQSPGRYPKRYLREPVSNYEDFTGTELT